MTYSSDRSYVNLAQYVKKGWDVAKIIPKSKSNPATIYEN